MFSMVRGKVWSLQCMESIAISAYMCQLGCICLFLESMCIVLKARVESGRGQDQYYYSGDITALCIANNISQGSQSISWDIKLIVYRQYRSPDVLYNNIIQINHSIIIYEHVSRVVQLYNIHSGITQRKMRLLVFMIIVVQHFTSELLLQATGGNYNYVHCYNG